jgi:hypothetical protein
MTQDASVLTDGTRVSPDGVASSLNGAALLTETVTPLTDGTASSPEDVASSSNGAVPSPETEALLTDGEAPSVESEASSVAFSQVFGGFPRFRGVIAPLCG